MQISECREASVRIVEKALNLKRSNNAGQHFAVTNTKTRAKSITLSGNANKKQKVHVS